MKSFEQNYNDIGEDLVESINTSEAKWPRTTPPEALQAAHYRAQLIIAAELRTIRQLMEEKAK